jgi:F0F1-type ATP synthase beta subunit
LRKGGRTLKVGKVLRVIGPVVDVEFFAEELPALYNAIRIDRPDGTKLIVEVSQYLGENVVQKLSGMPKEKNRNAMRIALSA